MICTWCCYVIAKKLFYYHELGWMAYRPEVCHSPSPSTSVTLKESAWVLCITLGMMTMITEKNLGLGERIWKTMLVKCIVQCIHTLHIHIHVYREKYIYMHIYVCTIYLHTHTYGECFQGMHLKSYLLFLLFKNIGIFCGTGLNIMNGFWKN